MDLKQFKLPQQSKELEKQLLKEGLVAGNVITVEFTFDKQSQKLLALSEYRDKVKNHLDAGNEVTFKFTKTGFITQTAHPEIPSDACKYLKKNMGINATYQIIKFSRGK